MAICTGPFIVLLRPQAHRSLYLTLIPPILEYGSTPYHPFNSKLTKRIEATQRFCLAGLETVSHFFLNVVILPPYVSCSRSSTISAPRQTLAIPITVQGPGLRNLNSMDLDTPFCRLSLTQKSFYSYVPTLWNYLPDSTVKCPALTAFKSAIRQLLY